MKKLTCIEEDLKKRRLQEKRELEEQRREQEEEVIVIVTEENRHRVSTKYDGLLRNDNGTYSLTPQFLAWYNNRKIQLQTSYSEDREKPP